MKKLKNLSLHRLNQSEMSKKEMNALTGGASCACHCTCTCNFHCRCNYAGEQEGPYDSYYGGSSTNANSDSIGNNARDALGGNLVTNIGRSDVKSYPIY